MEVERLGRGEQRGAAAPRFFRHCVDTTRFKVAKFLLLHLSRLIQWDEDNLHLRLIGAFGRRPRAQNARDKYDAAGPPKAGAGRICWWPQLAMLGFLYASAKLLLTSYHTTCLFKHQRALERLAGGCETSPDCQGAQQRRKLELIRQSLAQANQSLEQLGAPFAEATIVAAGGYLIIINLACLTYLMPQLLYNYLGAMGWFLVHLVLNETREFNYCSQLVGEALAAFEVSSCNNVAAVRGRVEELARLPLLDGRQRGQARRLQWTRHTSGSFRLQTLDFDRCPLAARVHAQELHLSHSAFNEAARDHRRLIDQLERLRARGLARLMPINRTPERVDLMLLVFGLFFVLNTLGTLSLDLFLAFGLPALLQMPLRYGWPDIQSLVVLFALVQLHQLTTSLNVGLATAHCFDQLRYASELAEQIAACIREGDLQFALLNARGVHQSSATAAAAASDSLAVEACAWRLNERLLETLLRYRIFVAQLRPIRNACGAFVLSFVHLIFIMPLTMRLFTPYVPGSNGFALLISLVLAGYSDYCINPLCLLHVKGQLLYRRLSSLLAHTISLDERAVGRLGAGRRLYASCLVDMLRRELSGPSLLIEQFVTKVLGLRATYSTMVRFHFYYSVLIISLFSELQSWRHLLGSRLQDPLGLAGGD